MKSAGKLGPTDCVGCGLAAQCIYREKLFWPCHNLSTTCSELAKKERKEEKDSLAE